MNLTLLKGYNNYFDRIVKREETLEEYYNLVESYENKENINFVPNDGINTEQIINGWAESWTPDYIIVSDEMYKIISRWFVIDAVRTRGKQYRLILKRDVIADKIKNILDAPIYVEKGIVESYDPLIYNEENMQFNEIKKDELLLKDKSKCAWLVGYYTKKHEKKEFTYNQNVLSLPSTKFEDLSADQKRIFLLALNKTEFTKRDIIELTMSVGVAQVIRPQFGGRTTTATLKYILNTNNTGTKQNSSVVNGGYAEYVCYNSNAGQVITREIADEFIANTDNNISKYFDNNEGFKKIISVIPGTSNIKINDETFIKKIYAHNTEYDKFDFATPEIIKTLKSLNGKRILYNGVVYYAKYNEKSINANYNFSSDSELYKYLTSITGGQRPAKQGLKIGNCKYSTVNYILDVKKTTTTTSDKYKVTFDDKYASSENTIEHLSSDTLYDIFYLPYTDHLYVFDISESKYVELPFYNKSVALGMASAIISGSGGTGAGNTLCYDVQLLPYCPDPDFKYFDTYLSTDDALYIDGVGYIDKPGVSISDSHTYNHILDSSNKIVGYIFWALKSKMEINLFPEIPEWLKVKNNNIDKKIQVSCDFIRLCSPNYSGLFDFNVAKNEGVSYFNCDMVFKPFNPYIHINPNFGGLYNRDFNDSRGLICGGDYSIGSTTDAWTQYELNNKNYQQMFDREIEHMDKIHKYDMTSNIISSLVGAGTTGIGAQGAASIAGIGGPVGLIAGGASAIGGAIDIGLGEGKYNESKSFKTDMFNMSLQNIKAQPTSLSKISAITNNNKIWPFVEYYSCTDIEKETFRKKIIYNGMTVMRIGTLKEFISNKNENKKFFKGQLIRCEDLNDDAHIKNVIFEELNKGVYI